MLQNLINKIKRTEVPTVAAPTTSPVWDENDDDEDDVSAQQLDEWLESIWSKHGDLPVGDGYAGAEL